MISSLIFQAAAPLLLTLGCASGVDTADAASVDPSTAELHCSEQNSAGLAMDARRVASMMDAAVCQRPVQTTGNKQ
ncbi:MAG: hypothetical protein AB8G16_14740, partial [Gammaproteobacteria bacterium]